MPSQNQAARQPTWSISHCASGGCEAIVSEKPRPIRLSAKPRLRSNHCATRLAEHSISEPWPRKRRAAKPSARVAMPVTVPNAIAAKPNSTATPRRTGRTP